MLIPDTESDFSIPVPDPGVKKALEKYYIKISVYKTAETFTSADPGPLNSAEST
jgi:hypothetical protein